MTAPRSRSVFAIGTILAIILHALSFACMVLVRSAIAQILLGNSFDPYVSSALSGMGAHVLPLLASAGVVLSAIALARVSQRRAALIPILASVAVIPGLGLLLQEVMFIALTDSGNHPDMRSIWLLLTILELAGIILCGLIAIAAVIVVWRGGTAERALVSHRTKVLPVLVVVAAVFVILAEVWGIAVSVSAPPRTVGGSASLVFALRHLVAALPVMLAGTALTTLVALMVAASAPQGVFSAWIAAVTAAVFPVVQHVVSIAALLLAEPVEDGGRNVALAVSGLPVLLFATAIIIVFTLRSASRSRAVPPHPDHLPR